MGSMDQVTSLSGTKHDVSGYGFVGTLVRLELVWTMSGPIWSRFRWFVTQWLWGVLQVVEVTHAMLWISDLRQNQWNVYCRVHMGSSTLHMVNSPECWFHRWRTQCWKHRVQVDALRLRRETQDLWGSLVSICSNSEMDKTRTNGYVKRFPWIFPLMDGKCKNPWKANCRGFVVEDLQSSQHPRQAAGMKAGTLAIPRLRKMLKKVPMSHVGTVVYRWNMSRNNPRIYIYI